MSEKILEIRHLSKTFGTNLVLKDIDFTVNSKDVTCIIGASGSGKSTLLRCLNLLETPTTGEILYHGNNIADAKVNAPKYRSRVGMVFQSFNLIDELNVYENVELPLTYLGFKASERRRMVEDILKRMNIWFAGMTTKADSISVCRLPFSLSGLPEAEIFFLQL